MTPQEQPVIGEFVDGIDSHVVNERAVRASAGLLFLGGIIAFMIAALNGEYQPLRMFGAIFMFDMTFRLFIGTKYTPSLIIGSLLVRAQRPEWVGAAQKKLAWSIGLGMAFISCGVMGFLNVSNGVTLALCSLCLSLLFLETAFSICLGCELQRAFAKQKPQMCAGDTCSYVPPKRGERHTVQPESRQFLQVPNEFDRGVSMERPAADRVGSGIESDSRPDR
ncbi:MULTISPECIES: DUF4395 domain-containing protein [unclassified Cryobacterium]|uniref:DUF4395 domain-containing protein n=1 Tax=unclassified Cryobacterium TaxID=2649013 RepID=UPI00106CA78B|nr:MULTISPECIES: DUF4395 domain-containing protein [unclassified Cryobacterium]TFC34714.1 DUF4395 domain-containing protein [Cryobacterium sp. TMT2-42-4]TFC54182.1 DUF4395 domain-containing protein [Cryobacterium sp. TMT2-15-1]